MPNVEFESLSQRRPINKLLRAMMRAQNANPRILTPSSAGVTITDNGPSAPTHTSGSTPYNITPSSFGVWSVSGGKPFNIGGALRYYSAVISATGGNGGSNDGKQVNHFRASAMVNARYVTLKLFPTTSPYRFMIDKRYISLAGTVLGVTTGNVQQYVTLDLGSRRLCEITVEGQNTCGFAGALVEPTGMISPVEVSDDVRLVYLGDSYPGGASSVNRNDEIVPILADMLGVKVLASGSGGTGFNHANASVFRFDQRIVNGDLGLDQVPPDAICLMASVNDRNRDMTVVQANALVALQAVRALYPLSTGIPIVVYGCMPIPVGPLANIISCEQAVQAAVDAFADPLCRFVPIATDPMGSWTNGDGVRAQFTAALSAANSGTLTSNWGRTSGAYTIAFDDGTTRAGTFTSGSTAVTWTGGAVTAGALASAYVTAPGNSSWMFASDGTHLYDDGTGAVSGTFVIARREAIAFAAAIRSMAG